MAKTLYLIRHGATEGNGQKRYKGTIDVPLSERGIRQIEKMASYLYETLQCKENPIPALYSSPLSRAYKSAEIIGEKFGLKPAVIEEFKERNFGLWEGMTFDEIISSYPQEFEAWKVDPLKYSPPQGESTLQVRDRVIRGFKKIEALTHCIIIVAHGGVNRIILCELLGIPLENIFRIEQDYGCLNIIEFYDHYPVVKLLNFTIT
ncbi:MAG: alpha-ribazole phosphatase [Thermodesulfovibrionales bacterium]